jgi:hypothetical protein
MWSAQYLCNPTPIEGGVLKAERFHYWHPTNEDPANRIYKLPPREKLHIFQGCAIAMSEGHSADWTVGLTLWLAQDGTAYVLDFR